jgi:hypothetical protein
MQPGSRATSSWPTLYLKYERVLYSTSGFPIRLNTTIVSRNTVVQDVSFSKILIFVFYTIRELYISNV